MRLINSVGRAVVVQRALTVPNTTPSAKKVISILATGVVQTDDAAKLRISLGANGKHLIIDGPHIDRVIPHLALVQRLLNVMLPSVLPPCADGILLAGDRGLTGKRLRRER